MPKGSGGSGSGGRTGSDDAGQPGEVARAANELQAARDAYDQANREMMKYKPRTDEYDAAKRKRNEAARKVDEAGAKLIAAESGTKPLSAAERASRNLEFSRQSNIMEGGKSFENPSVYKSNAPPKYNPKAKSETPKKQETKTYKVGDVISTPRGRFRYNKYGTWDQA